jgi:SAM-dependent methyltransferase
MSLEGTVRELLGNREEITILEAGCGSMSHFNHGIFHNARLVGIDLSEEQLEKNTYLKEKILGDIQDPNSLPASAYDLIICWDVLEHLPDPAMALKNFFHAVRNGGVILLASPNVLTVRGLIVKLTPHIFHVWFYRHIAGHKEAGSPGSWPFKSYHRFTMSPTFIKKFAKKNDLVVELERYSMWESYEYKFFLFKVIWKPLNTLVKMLTFGAIGTDKKMAFQILLKKK